jgi:ectoine hydroxylase-related dioxygenase (phytanoyl-CoA dioxygenase family)
VKHIKSDALRQPLIWYKGLAAADPEISRVGQLPALVNAVRHVLGPDIALWGANVIRRKPGQPHPWHCDTESHHPGGGFVTAWVALEHVTPQTTPVFVTRTHPNAKPVQQVRQERGIRRDAVDDDTIVQLARQSDPACCLAAPPVRNGQAILFDGRIWHATHNTQRDRTRLALLLQYCRADIAVRIPVGHQTEWPFRMSDELAPLIPIPSKAAV